MKVKVRWLIDGVMEVEADSHDEAEQKAQQLLAAIIEQVPELTKYYGAQAIQGQAITEEDEPSIN